MENSNVFLQSQQRVLFEKVSSYISILVNTYIIIKEYVVDRKSKKYSGKSQTIDE